MSGWIKLHRQIIDSEWFTDVNTNHLFTYCLLRANHKDATWRGIDIKRGCFITSLDTLSKETGLTIRQVRTSLDKLKVTSNLTSQPTNKYRLITITNYIKFQDDDKQPDKPVTSQRQTNDKPVTTDKNEKNNKNEKEKKEDDFLKYKNIKFLLDKTSHYVSISDRKFIQDYDKKQGA